MLKLLSVVGARPNFIKMAPVIRTLLTHYSSEVHSVLCHTGQHFDDKMSKVFFNDLQIPKPDFNLEINGGSQAVQTALIMQEFEKIVLKEKPDIILVPGDVTSTLAASLVASKLGISIAHIEAGLRSFDRSMPEEINRMITDVLSDFLFVTEESGLKNLTHEGINPDKVHFAGNVMIDSLVYFMPKIQASNIHVNLGVEPGRYGLVTFHRPSNVDEVDYLRDLMNYLIDLSSRLPIVFPIHPRTRKNLIQRGIEISSDNHLILTEPIGYLDFLALARSASLVITDSGGIQEETTCLNVQCVTVRNNTERPVTVEMGTNHLAGTNLENVKKTVDKILSGDRKTGKIPPLWDGHAAERIVNVLCS